MREEFDKFKYNYKRKALIYGIASGVACGLVAVGVLLLALKLNYIVWGWYLYLIIGIGVAAAAGVAVFFALNPSDDKLAKKLDKMYALDEKAQTMIEYGGRQGAMLDMQRADAEASLKAVKKRRPSVVGIILKSVAAIVAIVLFVSGVAVSQRVHEAQASTPYTVDEDDLAKLKTLIDDVEGDETLESGVQTSYLAVLNTLYEDLQTEGITKDDMVGLVQASMYAVSDATIASTTYDDLAYGLTVSGDAIFSVALRSSAKSYAEIKENLNSYEDLATVNDKLFTTIYDYISAACDGFAEQVKALTEDTVNTELGLYVTAFGNALNDEDLIVYYNALADGGVDFGNKSRGGVASGDALYDALYDLYYTVNNNLNSYNDGSVSLAGGSYSLITVIAGSGTETGGAAYNFLTASVSAMQVQAYTYMADVYIRMTLGSIFSVEVVGHTVDDGSSEASEGDEEAGGNNNSSGTGETQYPGDDYIYNPENGSYEFYIDMLNNGYRSELMNLLTDENISDEVKNYIRAYLNYLTSTSTDQ